MGLVFYLGEDKDLVEAYDSVVNGTGIASEVETYRELHKLLTEVEERQITAHSSELTSMQQSVLDYYDKTIKRDFTQRFAGLSIEDKLLFWEFSSRRGFHATRLTYARTRGHLIDSFMAEGYLSHDLKIALFGRFPNLWSLASWVYDNHDPEEIKSWRNRTTIFAMIKVARDKKTTWDAVEFLLCDDLVSFRTGNDFMRNLDKEIITIDFANKMLECRIDSDLISISMEVAVHCLRTAHKIDESVPDEWVERMFM